MRSIEIYIEMFGVAMTRKATTLFLFDNDDSEWLMC